MDFAIVDMQGFKDTNNEFIVKEFSLFTKNIKFHDIIKSPFEFMETGESSTKSIEWLTRNYHGIAWNDGYITVEELQKTLEPILRNKIIYAKGKEKILWLRKIMFNCAENLLIVNLEDIGCDLNLNTKNDDDDNNKLGIFKKILAADPPMTCSKHKRMPLNFNCSMRNAVKLKLWYSSFCKTKKKKR